jgi:proteasome lid subunit RPN8/RPN11
MNKTQSRTTAAADGPPSPPTNVTTALKTPKVKAIEFLKPRPPEERVLTFAPLAWLKLQYLCHAGDSEIGGFAVTAAADPLYVEQFETVLQGATSVTVEFSDDAVADFFDRCVDRGLSPQRFARIWCHTHPGESAQPSYTDERTFARVFGACDWSLMFILGRTGQTYARLSFSAGPGGCVLLPVRVDWQRWPKDLLAEPQQLDERVRSWRQEYEANVHVLSAFAFGAPLGGLWAEELDLLAEDVAQEREFEEYLDAVAELRGEGMP